MVFSRFPDRMSKHSDVKIFVDEYGRVHVLGKIIMSIYLPPGLPESDRVRFR